MRRAKQMMGRIKRRSLHDKILILVNYVVAIIMLISACLLDSEDCMVFLTITAVCAGYLGLFTYANSDRGGIL